MRTALAILIGLAGFAFIAPAEAASYKSLKAKGYKTSSWTRSPSGRRGWRVSGGGKRYFCTMRVGLARNGSKAVGFTTSGRIIPMAGRPRKGAPNLADLKAGRPRARDVGSCRKLR